MLYFLPNGQRQIVLEGKGHVFRETIRKENRRKGNTVMI